MVMQALYGARNSSVSIFATSRPMNEALSDDSNLEGGPGGTRADDWDPGAARLDLLSRGGDSGLDRGGENHSQCGVSLLLSKRCVERQAVGRSSGCGSDQGGDLSSEGSLIGLSPVFWL